MLRNSFILITALGFLMIFASAAMAIPVNIIVEGPQDEYPYCLNLKVPASIENGRTLVPLRPVAEALGCRVDWQADGQKIKVYNNQQRIEMQIGSELALVNNASCKMEIPPRLFKNTTLVPLRSFAQSLNYSVAYSTVWHEKQADIYITPYTLIDDEELAGINESNFDKVPLEEAGPGGNYYYQLKKNGLSPAGIAWGASIQDVLKTYGIPRDPKRSPEYDSNWSGVLSYWGTFIPQSDCGSWVDFRFSDGNLVNMTVHY